MKDEDQSGQRHPDDAGAEFDRFRALATHILTTPKADLVKRAAKKGKPAKKRKK